MRKVAKFSSIAARYPWAKWADGKTRDAVHGVDFDCTPIGFRASLYGYARRNKLKVRVSRNGTTVRFQFVGKKLAKHGGSR